MNLKLRSTAIAAVVAGVLAIAPSAMSASGNRVGGYDFGYATNGQGRILPVQVFDNGRETYFQFRAGDPIPAIFQVKGKEAKLMIPTFEGPYVKIADTAARYTLQLGRVQAQVVYVAGGRDEGIRVGAFDVDGQQLAPAAGTRDPKARLVASLENGAQYINVTALEANSYATPLRGDRIEWKDTEITTEEEKVWFPKGQPYLGKNALRDVAALGSRVRTATSITIIGRDDTSHKVGLEAERANAIKQALVRAGVPSNVISVRTGGAGKEENGLWPSDIRVEMTSPTRVARGGNGNSDTAQANIRQLLKSGVINADQAAIMLRRVGVQEAQIRAQQEEVVRPVAAEKPLSAEPVKRHVEVPEGGFQFRVTDRTVSSTLRRWAAETGHQLLWEVPTAYDARITGNATMHADGMKDAVEKVLLSMQRKGYPIQATIYSNRVIRVTSSN